LAVGAVTASELAAGSVTAGKIAATAIDAMTITGALVRSAATGNRFELAQVTGVGSLEFFAGIGGEIPATIKATTLGGATPAQMFSLTGDTNIDGTHPEIDLYSQGAPAGGWESVIELDADVVFINGETYGGVGAVGATMGTPTATGTNGTATSSTTDTRDAVLGNYTFTALAARRYRVILDGARANTTVSGDQVVFNIRNGGASTPTAASPGVIASRILLAVTGGPGQISLPMSGSFVPGAGTVTLSLFVQRGSGTGVELAAGSRELYAIDLGPA